MNAPIDWLKSMREQTPTPSLRILPVAKFRLRDPVTLTIQRDGSVVEQPGWVVARVWVRGKWLYDVAPIPTGAPHQNAEESDLKAREGDKFGSKLVGAVEAA